MKILATYRNDDMDDVSVASLKYNVGVIKQIYVPDGMEIKSIYYGKNKDSVFYGLEVSSVDINTRDIRGKLLAKGGTFYKFVSKNDSIDISNSTLRNFDFSITISMYEKILSDGTISVHYTALPNYASSSSYVDTHSKTEWLLTIQDFFIDMYNVIIDEISSGKVI